MEKTEGLEEAALLEGAQLDPPDTTRDELAAVPAAGAGRRRPFRAGHAREARVGDPEVGFVQEAFPVGQRGSLLRRPQQGRDPFGSAVCGTARVEPVDAGRVPLAVGIRQLLAETQSAFVDSAAASATAGAAAGGRLQPVRHDRDSLLSTV